MIREILRMGDPRLLEKSRPVEAFGTTELRTLIGDMQDTMRAANGAGLAAPQVGIGLRVVIFGFEASPRYPQAEPVPFTILVNPVVTPLAEEMEEGWEGCLSVPGLRGMCRAGCICAIAASMPKASRSSARRAGFMPASCSTNATTSTAFSIRCACVTSRASASPTCCFRTQTSRKIRLRRAQESAGQRKMQDSR